MATDEDKKGNEEPINPLVEKMMKRFGSPDAIGPIDYLKAAGYELSFEMLWMPKPGLKKSSKMTDDERDCLDFLKAFYHHGGLAGIEGRAAPPDHTPR